jgi:hypothetical protein
MYICLSLFPGPDLYIRIVYTPIAISRARFVSTNCIYAYHYFQGHIRIFVFFKKKRLPGVGSEPGSSPFHLFSHFSPLYRWATAAPHIPIFVYIRIVYMHITISRASLSPSSFWEGPSPRASIKSSDCRPTLRGRVFWGEEKERGKSNCQVKRTRLFFSWKKGFWKILLFSNTLDDNAVKFLQQLCNV